MGHIHFRYYYAIAIFDSKETAHHIYNELDGVEISHSGSYFDLRFVPDGMSFDEDEPKEVCAKYDPGYKPGKPFVTNALQNSNFAISWDQDAPLRKQTLAKCFDDEFLQDKTELDLSMYLASSEEDSEEENATAGVPILCSYL